MRMVADTIANVRGWTTGHCSGSNPKPRFGVRGGAPPSVRSLGWVEDSIDGSCARKILVTARGLAGFVISKQLSCSSHSLRHQRCCSGGGGLDFLCWLGLVSPLMFSPKSSILHDTVFAAYFSGHLIIECLKRCSPRRRARRKAVTLSDHGAGSRAIPPLKARGHAMWGETKAHPTLTLLVA